MLKKFIQFCYMHVLPQNFDVGGFVVCYNKQFMFVMIAKNGSTSLRNYVIQYDFKQNSENIYEKIGLARNKQHRVQISHAKSQKYSNFVKFAIYRDPVERLLSTYKNKIMLPITSFYGYYKKCGIINCDLDEFLDFVERDLKKQTIKQDQHLRPQHLSYKMTDVDYIVPLHHLDDFIKNHLKFTDFQLRKNSTKYKTVTISNTQRQRIQKIYQKDYEIVCNYPA